MIIYVSHAKAFDYQNELYKPLINSSLNIEHDIILPHEDSDAPTNSKALMEDVYELMIAEVSHRATGLGIELGWADAFNLPLICLCKKGVKIPGSVKVLTKNIIEYSDADDMISQLKKMIKFVAKWQEKNYLKEKKNVAR